MTVEGRTDKELMLAYVDGDSTAFDELYTRHAPRVFGFIKNRLVSTAQAEEAFQDVFLKLHRLRAHYNQHLPFLPWLFTITKTVINDKLRRERRYQGGETTFEESISPNLERMLDADQILRSLSSIDRELLMQHFAEGLTFEEITKNLGGTSMSLRQRVSRLLRRLQKNYETT